MKGPIHPRDISCRKEISGKPIGLSKNAIHLICVIVMQLLQLTQGLVTEEDLSNYNAVKNVGNINLTVIAPSTRSCLLERGTSIMSAVHNDGLRSHNIFMDMVSPSAVMASVEGFQIVDSLLLPQVPCAPFISCDIVAPGDSSCCDNLAETQNENHQVLSTDRRNVSTASSSESFAITATPVLETVDISLEELSVSKEDHSPSLQKMLQELIVDPNSNFIQTTDEKCESHEVFLSPNSSIGQIRFRVKREADGSKKSPLSARNRFRRPTTTRTTTEEEVTEEVTQPAIQRRNFKSGNLHSNTNKPTVASKKRLIKPSRVSTVPSNRAKFTLREETTTQKSSTSARRPPFRRPQLSSGSSGNKRVTNSKINSSVGSNRRVNTHEESHTRSTLGNRGRTPSSTGRSRSGSFKESDARVRNRGNQDFNNEPVLPLDDGTITVTHLTPSETQIPVVNGQVTEYKQIVVAKTSTEVLGPQQYTTSFAANGQSILVLTSQGSSVNHAGATEITQYILHESPTTSVTFTPTTIRGRRTSFSYVLPSTAYSVENIVSTVQPQISADAPLANILLSQLLLGNVGFPTNQLFGAGDNNANINANLNGGVQTPTTEFRTHTTTYVTTVVEGSSTVLPITFQGKKIITTIYDTTAKVITATEFVTDTIVLPGVAQPQAQAQGQNPINNLLLQQLLLQQVAQKQEQNPVPHINPTQQQSFENTKLPDYDNENHVRDSGHNVLMPSGNSFNRDDAGEVTTERGKTRRNGKKHKKRNKEEAKSGETSIVTLYVSGKFPGEFSTVLSTVYVRPEATVRKRHATDYYSENDLQETTEEDFQLPNSLGSESVIVSKQEATQSLSDILGERHKWYVVRKPISV